MIKTIKLLLTLVLALHWITSHAQDTGNQVKNDVNIIFPRKLSPDGKWLLYNKFNEKMLSFPHCMFLNTKTKQTISLKQNNYFYHHLLKNDFLIGLDKDILSIINLSDTTKTKKIPNIIQFDSDKNKNIIFTLNKNGELNIIELNKNNNNLIFTISNVNKYFTNPNKSILIYQENDSKKLYSIFLHNFETRSLITPLQDISDVQWNQMQNCILLKNTIDNNLIFIDLIREEYRNIELPEKKLEDLQLSIYPNNDIFVNFTTRESEIIPESDYITIWSSNSGRIIPPSIRNRNINYHYAMVYSYNTKQWIELEASEERKYKTNTIPDFVIYTTPYKDNQFLRFSPETNNYIQNIYTKETKVLSAISGNQLYISPDNRHILYPKENSDHWEVYTPTTGKRTTIEKDPIGSQIPLWSTDSKYIVFNKDNNIVKQEVSTAKITRLSYFKGTADFNFVEQIVNQKFIDLTKPLVYTVRINHKTAIYKIKNGKSFNILPFTSNKISNISSETIAQDFKTIVWLEENYNLPHTINTYKNHTIMTLVNSPLPLEDYSWQKQKSIQFKDSNGLVLEGVLYYPKNFDPQKKYPMITFIYNEIWKTSGYNPNEYIASTYYNQDSQNRTLFNELDYFVFTPDTYVSETGPGITAVDCIESAIYAVLKAEPSIDEKKIGLTGGSFGGYKSSLIASHSNLFAAIVSSSGPTDLVGYYYHYSLNFRNIPEYGRIEGGQYKMKQTFADNPQKYYDNSPIVHAHKIKTPMLLIAGLEDTNVNWEMTSTLFWALKRYNNTEFIALLYHDMKHAFPTKSEVSKDATKRIIDWFDYYLKNKKEIKWISDRVDPNKNFIEIN